MKAEDRFFPESRPHIGDTEPLRRTLSADREMNFLLRHEPVSTCDIDIWVDDTSEDRIRCEAALADLQAEWGRSEEDWGPVVEEAPGWLDFQPTLCLNSPHGAIDVFGTVAGLGPCAESRARAVTGATAGGSSHVAIPDEDTLRCQMALPESQPKLDRIAALRRLLEEG